MRCKHTMGVEPMSSSIDAAIATARTLPPEPRRDQLPAGPCPAVACVVLGAFCTAR
jgi:hypothetical protein